MNTGERVNASIKRKEKQYRKGGGDKSSPEPWSPKKRRIVRARNSINSSDEVQWPEPPKPHREKVWSNTPSSPSWMLSWKLRLTIIRWPRLNLSNPRSTNYIVWAFNVRIQYHLGVVTNWIPTILINLLDTKIKKLKCTHGTKLTYNWNLIWNLIIFSLSFDSIYIYIHFLNVYDWKPKCFSPFCRKQETKV